MGEEYVRNSSQSKSSSSPWVKSHRLGSESSSNVHPAAEKEDREEGVYDQFSHFHLPLITMLAPVKPTSLFPSRLMLN